MLPTLTTARLSLRPCTPDDTAALHALWTDPGVRRFLWDDRAIERDEAAAVVQALCDTANQRRGGLWLIETRPGEPPAGFCALREIGGTTEIEIIYGLASDHWGQGLATEASRAVLAYGFDVLSLTRIWGRTDPPNIHSLAVLARLGMQPAVNPGHETQPMATFVLERSA
ncbi:MAG: GNAT family N-acetyltransferase [Pirellulales bacterium]